MRYFDTFTGIGGFTRAIEQAYENKNIRNNPRELQTEGELSSEGENPISNTCESSNNKPESDALVCVGYSEIDKYASSIYQKHYPEHKNYGDITKINTADLPDFDLLVGGFPCQAFSIAGKRGGFEDTRGTLFFELARILRDKKPRLFVFENVKGLLSHDQGNTFKTIIEAIDELGYDCQWQVLNSKNFGVPQNRERVFIVGHLRGTSRPEVFPITGTNGKDIIVNGILDTETWRKRHEQIRRTHSIEGISPTLPTGTGGGVMTKILQIGTRLDSNSGTQPFQQDRVYDTNGISPALQQALPEGGHKITEDKVSVRRLTPIECERLQGFPDNWTEGISDTQRYKCCGNAVTVNVVQAIMERLL